MPSRMIGPSSCNWIAPWSRSVTPRMPSPPLARKSLVTRVSFSRGPTFLPLFSRVKLTTSRSPVQRALTRTPEMENTPDETVRLCSITLASWAPVSLTVANRLSNGIDS